MSGLIDPAHALAALRGLKNDQDLARLLDTSPARLSYHLYARRQSYRSFQINKKGGGKRTILAPPSPVRFWQRTLADLLVAAYPRKKGAYGFCLGGGVVRNAQRHVRSAVVLNLDLKDFFDTIHFGRVRGVFEAEPFCIPRSVASILAHLCCWQRKLPQGAPTSPILSNYVCRSLDSDLARLAQKHRCQYTRYADDITFSARRRDLPTAILKSRAAGDVELGDDLVHVLRKARFEVNQAKVWVRTPRERQTVTGLVVNRRVNVRKEYRRNLRAALHVWDRQGFFDAERRFVEHGGKLWDGNSDVPPFLQHLQGKISFLSQVRGSDDPMAAEFRIRLVELCIRDGLPWKPVLLVGRAAWVPELLKYAVWIVTAHAGDEQAPLWTGTAWSMNHGSIVTNQHVTEDWHQVLHGGTSERRNEPQPVVRWVGEQLKRLVRWVAGTREPEEPGEGSQEEGPRTLALRIRSAARPSESFQVDEVVVASHKNYDLARLVCHVQPVAVLDVCGEPPIPGEEVLLAGFPDWRHHGESCRIEEGVVNHVRRISGITWIEISPRIRPGNSGGPVLGGGGTVIGVATKDENGTPVQNAAIAIEHVFQIPGTKKGGAR